MEGSLPITEQSDLSDWIKSTLGQKVLYIQRLPSMYLKQCCGSGMFIPAPGSEFFPSRIPESHQRIYIFFTQKIVSKLSESEI